MTADKAVADVTITNGTLAIDNFDGDLYDGKLRGKASFVLAENAPYRFDFTTEHVDVRKLLTAITTKTKHGQRQINRRSLDCRSRQRSRPNQRGRQTND